VQNSFSGSLSAVGIEIARQDDNHLLLTHANLMFLLWRGIQVPATCGTIYDMGVALAQKCGTGKVSVLSIVQAGATPPSHAAREALAALHDDPQRVIHRSALVFPNDGFVGAIIRSIALNVRQRARRRQGHEVFHKVEKALSWVTENLPTARNRPIPVSALAQALSKFDPANQAKVA
jgi:hypothetical protein